MKKAFQIILFLGIVFSFNSCRTKGCTDPKAKNFSYEADLDDGSCNYGGCTDQDAINYDPDAQENDGSCKYNGGVKIISTRAILDSLNTFLSVNINDEYIGKIDYPCQTSFPDCNTVCAHVNFTNQSEGTYLLSFFEIRIDSSLQIDTLFVSNQEIFTITGGECKIISLD